MRHLALRRITTNIKDLLLLSPYFVPVCAYLLSCAQLFVTPSTVAYQAFLSMGFPSQEYWSGLPFPSPGDLSDPEIEPTFLVSPALAGGFFTTGTNWEAHS